MTRVPTVRKADLDRAIKALADAGMTVAAVEVRPGGQVVITPKPAPTALTADDLASQPPEPSQGPPEDLDAWRHRKRGHRAAQGS